jgi:hypothetical protein
MPSSLFTSSEDAPMDWPVNVEYRPSYNMASTISVLPIRVPHRAWGMRYGASLIDSNPPATATSISPARMSWSARAMAFMPDRHTLLMVMAGTSLGIPALMAAWRAVICPAPAWITCPMST